MKFFNITLSIMTGLAGGFIGQRLYPTTSVYAQAGLTAPKTIEAGSFRLINAAGHVAGSLAINANGDGVITMFDANGKAIFTSDDKPIVKPAVR